MTPHDLIAAFETLSEAPGGVKRLRELVLQLAVRGKLVAQDPGDEPASVLLERIATEKVRLMKEGEIRKSNPLRPIAEHETPFPVPASWAMVPFGDAFLTVFTGPFGTSLKKSEYQAGGTPVVNPQNLRDGCIEVTPDTCVGPTTLARLANFAIEARDLVVARRGEMGRCAVVTVVENGWLCGTGSLVLRPPTGLFPDFAAIYLRSPWTVTRLSGESVGSTMLNLNQRIMLNLPFGLPPLAEQHRIVARVDELMGLLDRLETARNAREATRAALRDAALAALRNALTPDEVEVAWLRIAERMDDLFTDPADVNPLRQAIFQLAVRGKLVPQDPADEPASALLEERVQTHAGSEEPFPLPLGWTWSSLGQLGEIRGGGTPSKDNSAFWGGAIPWVSPKDMKRSYIGESEDYITSVAVEGSAVKLIPTGSLLMVVRGMILAHSFPTALTTVEVTVNQDMKALTPFAAGLALYLLLATRGLKSEVLALVERSTHGTCKLSTEMLFDLPIPIPPLAEQQRIVAKVDELMTLLDRLEQRLKAQRDLQDAFAAAAVHHLDA